MSSSATEAFWSIPHVESEVSQQRPTQGLFRRQQAEVGDEIDEDVEHARDGEIDEEKLIQFPCIAHVFQLALGALFDKLHIWPTNDDFIKAWDEDSARSSTRQGKKGRGTELTDVQLILAKVSDCSRHCSQGWRGEQR